jgi:hypothetical protein
MCTSMVRARYDGTSLLHEVLQELKLFAGQTNRHAALSDIATFEVHPDAAKARANMGMRAFLRAP